MVSESSLMVWASLWSVVKSLSSYKNDMVMVWSILRLRFLMADTRKIAHTK